MPTIPHVPLNLDLNHFRTRVLADALNEATSGYWLRRAATFEAARPRPGDFTGRATARELAEQDARLAAIALACRRHAWLLRQVAEIMPEVRAAFAEAAA